MQLLNIVPSLYDLRFSGHLELLSPLLSDPLFQELLPFFFCHCTLCFLGSWALVGTTMFGTGLLNQNDNVHLDKRERYGRMILHGSWKICSWLPSVCIRHITLSEHFIVIPDKRDIFVRFLPGVLSIMFLILVINLIVVRISYPMQKNGCWQSSLFRNSAKCAECYTILSNLAFFFTNETVIFSININLQSIVALLRWCKKSCFQKCFMRKAQVGSCFQESSGPTGKGSSGVCHRKCRLSVEFPWLNVGNALLINTCIPYSNRILWVYRSYKMFPQVQGPWLCTCLVIVSLRLKLFQMTCESLEKQEMASTKVGHI